MLKCVHDTTEHTNSRSASVKGCTTGSLWLSARSDKPATITSTVDNLSLYAHGGFEISCKASSMAVHHRFDAMRVSIDMLLRNHYLSGRLTVKLVWL